MKKILLSLLLILLVLTGCNKIDDNDDKPNKDKEPNETEIDKVNKQMQDMTLDEKIGQMLMISYRSLVVDDNLKAVLNDVKPGGFIMFSENFESYEQTKKFVDDIKSTASIPMLISVDQEGGRVQRLKKLTDKEVTVFPTMSNLGKTGDKQLSYDVGRIMGEELGVFGINMDFAPVLDIYSNPKNTVIGNRAFGTTYEVVSNMGLSFASGLYSTGVIPVYKHFPGHGDTSTDSHYTLPVITKTKEELLNLELKPFIDAINNDAKVIMIGHLAVPKITGDNTPASLSKKVITDLLKEELGFKGVVITDALNMGALTNNYSKREIYTMAINSGVDILLMASPAKEAVKIIKEEVVKGNISEETINNSVRKILLLKFSINNDKNYDASYLGSSNHKEIVNKIPH